MKLSMVKRYRRRHRLSSALLLRNPVLVMGLDLPFIVAASTSLRNAAAMSLEMLILHVSTMLFAMFTCRALSGRKWLRVGANAAFSTVAMLGATLLLTSLFKGILDSLGVYIYLMAVNGMTQIQAANLDKKEKLWPMLTGAIFNVLGFSLTVFVVSCLREYFGNGTLWGIAVPVPMKMGGLLIPFAGFMIAAYLLALAKFLNKQIFGYMLTESLKREKRITVIR